MTRNPPGRFLLRPVWLFGSATGLVLAIIFGGVVFTSIQRAVLFPRHLIPALPAAYRPPKGVDVFHITHDEGQTEGWLLRPPHGLTNETPWVIFAHGNGELIDYSLDWAEGYMNMGFAVALLEYRGYGRSDGSPSELKIIEDYIQFYDMLLERFRLNADRGIFHGRSLGGGVVCGLARRRPPRALILESTFLGVAQIARGMGIPKFMITDRFDNESFVAESRIPMLIIHGKKDDVVPFSHGQRLAELNTAARLSVYDVGHNDLPDDSLRYWSELKSFLSFILK